VTRVVLWFREHRAATVALALLYAVAIVALHDVVQAIFGVLLEAVGRPVYTAIMLIATGAALAAATWAFWRRRTRHASLLRFYWVSTLASLPVAYVCLFAMASEAVHYLQFALLAVPVFALTRRVLDTLLWVTLLGAIDEGYQYWVLHGDWGIYYDFNDVVMNLLGAAMGVLFTLAFTDGAALGAPRPVRSAWRSPAFLTWAGLLVVAIVAWRTGHLALLPDTSEGTLVLLNRLGLHKNFWANVDWGKTYHVLRAEEGVLWIALLTAFYSLLDLLIAPRPADTGDRTSASPADRVLALFRRVTWSTQYQPFVDGLRFFSILSVVAYHVDTLAPAGEGPELLRTAAGYGNLGVQFFFAISGFILAVPMLEERLRGGPRVSLPRYYLRRLVRLEPPYLICLFGFFLTGLMTGKPEDPGRELAASAAYLYGALYDTFSTVNFVAWSLEVEVQFYLLMPLVAWLAFRGRRPWLRRGLIVGLTVPFVIRQGRIHDHFPHGLFLIDQIQFFVAGILLADVWVCGLRDRLQRETGRLPFDLLATIAFASAPWVTHVAWPAGRWVVPIGIGVGFYAALRGVVWRAILQNRWIAAVGGMCYTIYLYHWIILTRAVRCLWPAPRGVPDWTPGTVAFLLAVVLGVSALLYLAFERPFMAIRIRRPGRSGTTPRRVLATASLFSFLAASTLLAGCSRPSPRVRSVILISVDTLRPDFLSCYRPELDTTPHVARFAEGAAMFTDARSQAPSTTISHKSLLYSLYPAVHRTTRSQRPRESLASPVEALWARGFRTAALVGGGGLAPELGFPAGFESYEVLPALATGRQLETLRVRSIEWLREHRHERFFLFLHTYEPHCPYVPPEPWSARAGWYHGPLDPEGKCGRDYNRMDLDAEDYRYLRDLYAGEVSYTDGWLRDLFAALDSLDLSDETMVVLTSDHGESLGERGYVGHNQLFDLQLRIPLLIRIPGVPGRAIGDPVESVDVMPTVFEALDLPPPFPFQGRSLLAAVDGGPAPAPRARFANQGEGVSVRRGPWHLVVNEGLPELYRPDEDPEERTDLAGAHRDVVESLFREYAFVMEVARPVAGRFDVAAGRSTRLEEDTMDRLRALGYID